MSAVQCFFLQSKVCPHQNIQPTGDSDDLGVGIVLMAVCVRCSHLFKYGVCSWSSAGFAQCPWELTRHQILCLREISLLVLMLWGFNPVKTGPWVLYLNYIGLCLYDNDWLIIKPVLLFLPSIKPFPLFLSSFYFILQTAASLSLLLVLLPLNFPNQVDSMESVDTWTFT